MKIGFIGLGVMGKPMSSNLLRAGYHLVVLDLSKASMDDLVALGAERAETPQEVAERCDIIITMLPNSPQVREVILGHKGILKGIRSGSVLIDMSSIAPLVSRELAKTLLVHGVDMLDAPVSGGEPKAIDGTLTVMVGGPKIIFNRCLPIFRAMSSSAVHVGDIGAGNITKLANQIIVALNIAAISEALVLATKAGVDPESVFEAIRGGLAGSTALEAKAPMIMDRNFQPGFRIDLHIKDLNNVLDTAHELGVPIPLTASVMEILQSLKVDGLGNNDHGAVIRYYEKMSLVEVKRPIAK